LSRPNEGSPRDEIDEPPACLGDLGSRRRGRRRAGIRRGPWTARL